jgi:hypothetical protein
MKQTGSEDIKSTRKWTIPVGILALSVISVIAAGAGPVNSKTTVTKVNPNPETPPTESPAPDASPAIKVNGVEIPTNQSGARDISIPGGKARVEVSGGQTNVTANTNSSSSKGDTSNVQSSEVNIKIDSQSTNTNSNSSSSSRTSSDSHTSVFSTGDMDVTITR